MELKLGIPSAPIVVVNVGVPLRIPSIILPLTPAPKSNGAKLSLAFCIVLSISANHPLTKNPSSGLFISVICCGKYAP